MKTENWYEESGLMDKLTERKEFLLTPREHEALKRLAVHDGVSQGHVLRSALRTLAKRKKVWEPRRV